MTNGRPRNSFFRRTLLVSAAAFGTLGAVVLAQQVLPTSATSVQTTNERFEVVSIRKSDPVTNLPAGGRGGVGGAGDSSRPCKGGAPQVDPGRILLSNNSVYTLIAWANGTDCVNANAEGLISGGPDWIRKDQWVVQATIPHDSGVEIPSVPPPPWRDKMDPKLQKMLQNLLADRFQLVMHRDMKEVPIYALTVAKGGPKLNHPENASCTDVGDDGFFKPLKPGQNPYCSLHLRGFTLAEFLAVIQSDLDRPIVDKTGLTGTFEFRMLYSNPNRPGADPAGPSIFTALEAQLGLKLESTKGPIEILVVDRAERPSEN